MAPPDFGYIGGLSAVILTTPTTPNSTKQLNRMRFISQSLINLWHRLKWRKSSAYAFPVFPPPTPEELLARPNVYRERLFKRAYRTPKGQTEDTPLLSLYRFYERLILNDNIGLRNEIEYFWYAKWPVASIPDPQDPSASRYAVLSAIPALFVESFNQRIDLGLPRKADPIISREELEQYQKEDKIFESVPEWTTRVARLEKTLIIPHDNDEVLETFDDERASTQLAAKKHSALATAHSLYLRARFFGLSCYESCHDESCSCICLCSTKIDDDCPFVLASQGTWCNGGVDDNGFFWAINVPSRGYLAPKSLFQGFD